MRQSRRQPFLRLSRLNAAASAAALASSLFVPSSTETAIANGDTRTLNLYHSHTGESIQATFRVNGALDPAVLEKLNWFLRDWRNNERTRMDPRLFDVVWEAYRAAGATQPIVIVSAYRSPHTNAMLRRRSRGVAEHSQHILGKAMDTTMPGMPMERIREIGMRLQRGGVGWYPGSNFVHLDVGSVRSWPRMSYGQLVRLFPDGKTVHLAADGRTLPRYAEARAEIATRGGSLSDVPQSLPGSGVFAWLFGKHDEAAPSAATNAQPGAEAGRLTATAFDPAPDLRGGNGTGHGRQAGEGSTAVNFPPMPLPPPRPFQPGRETKIVFADVPTPPARPASAPRMASAPAQETWASKLVAAAMKSNALGEDANAPLTQAASLPVLITKGPADRQSVPKQVLAYTAADSPLEATPATALAQFERRLAPGPAAPQTGAVVAGSRLKPRGPGSSAMAAFPAPAILGQALTGLRRAARLIPGALSNKPSPEDYAAAFGALPGDLDPDHFSGAAIKPLTLAQGFARIGDPAKASLAN